ncbi:MAG: dihydropteroate synthase, partial [Candidatus Gastranaerophilaceae bacterium]
MRLIGENIHIISKKTREAIENKDKSYIQDYAIRQAQAGVEWIDLNIGPARRGWEGTMEWLVGIVEEVTDTALSLDTTNYKEIEAGLKIVKSPQKCILNSTSGDEVRLKNMVQLASEYETYLIALTLSDSTGIPKEADGRLEIACTILEAANDAGVNNGKILFDPLVLPVNVDQSQVMEALNSIRIFKESFDPPVLSIIGLSNVSNGCPKENRALINRIFAVMAMGCGLDT